MQEECWRFRFSKRTLCQLAVEDVNTLQQNLSQKTYELEALKKSYSQVRNCQACDLRLSRHSTQVPAEHPEHNIDCLVTLCKRLGLTLGPGSWQQH